MIDVRAKIAAGGYENHKPIVTGKDKEANLASRRAYREEDSRIRAEFQAEALEFAGLKANPKADKIFDYAWQERHSEGYSAVLDTLEELADLVQ